MSADLLKALREIAGLGKSEFQFPEDWSEQVASCAECQEYANHPVQAGICNTHRQPLWARDAFDRRQRLSLGIQAQQIASEAIAAHEAAIREPQGGEGFPHNYNGPELLKRAQERFPWNHPGRGEVVRSGVVAHAAEPKPDFEAMQRTISASVPVAEPIPTGVYYCRHAQNFYDTSCGGMGADFYFVWIKRHAEFPADITAARRPAPPTDEGKP